MLRHFLCIEVLSNTIGSRFHTSSKMASVGTHTSQLAEKFRGSLVGALVGDCFGAPFEGDFPVSKSILNNYFKDLLSDCPTAGSAQMRPYTDDTAMTRSVAISLIEKKEFDAVDMATRFTTEFYNNPRRGYGMNVVNVFKALKTDNYADVFRPAREQFNGSGSYGNGAAMRISPVALFCYKNEELLLELASSTSKITHAHADGYNGAILQCLAVHQALLSDSTEKMDPQLFLDNLIDKMNQIDVTKDLSSKIKKQEKTYVEKLKTAKLALENGTKSFSAEEIAVLLGNDVSASKSVPSAIYCFLRCQHPVSEFETTNPFTRTLYYAISLGGDTDTIASMACSIAGAYYGINLIPEKLQNRCEDLNVSISLADKLLEFVRA